MTARLVPRRLGVVALIAIAAAVVGGILVAAPGRASAAGVTRQDAIKELDQVRISIDETLALFRAGKDAEALEKAKSGYLNHFENVELPLRAIDPGLTVEAESLFAEVRQLVSHDAPSSAVKAKIVELRGLVDDVERRLTASNASAAAIVTGQSFLIIFREGLEVVLLLSVLLGYLESAKATQFRKPIMIGVALGALATVMTVVALQTVFAAFPASRELLEAITAMIAVLVLFYVSFWLISRLEHKRWMEFLRSKVWKAVAVGSATSLVLVGFTAVYREGFETALFYQALLSFGSGLGVWVAVGLVAGLVALAIVSVFIFRLGRRLPVRTFLSIAVAMIMVTSVAFLGNAVSGLQSAAVIDYHRLDNWPRLPIFLSEALGYWPTRETIGAQVALTLVYLVGAFYMFVIRPRRQRHRAEVSPSSVATAA
jgi:high-affinity iron transporter